MKTVRVLFPYIEAGYGHIMPMKSIEHKFREKYGDKVEILSCHFLSDSNDVHMIRYENMLKNQVRLSNSFIPAGYLLTLADSLVGPRLANFGSVRLFSPIAYKRSLQRMEEMKPDVVISTYWATNYYAEHMKNKPLTVLFCPDAHLSNIYGYHSDLYLIGMPKGYEEGLKRKIYNENNLKLVPFLIRDEAFNVETDKKLIRRKLGLPENNFTVLLAEGGYGIGKIYQTSKLLVNEHFPLTVIAVCGTNNKELEKMKSLEVSKEVTFMPVGFADNMLELQSASDVFCGKSGNILAEPTFFGNLSIVTHCANTVEQKIADHYINVVGSAIKEFSPKKVVQLIRQFAQDESLLEPYRKAAADYHDNFGPEKAVDVIWDKIVEKYPELNK